MADSSPMKPGCTDGGIKTNMNDVNIGMKNKPGIEKFGGTMNLDPSNSGQSVGGSGGGTGSEIMGPGKRDSAKGGI